MLFCLCYPFLSLFFQPRSGLTLCGMVASLDPDREGVQESVVAARNAGIRVATGFFKGEGNGKVL